MLKMGILALVAVLLAAQFKGSKNEYSIYISLAAGILIFIYGISRLEFIIETINEIQGYIRFHTEYVGTLVKMIGITYIAEFAASICKDSGYQAIASQIEIFGKLSILAISMPVILALLETIESLLV